MKNTIRTLQDALVYQLQGMLYAEDKITREFQSCSHHITSDEVRSVIEEYLSNSHDIKLKLDRVFNYLMVNPVKRKNQVIEKMIEETQVLLSYAGSSHLRNVLMIGCIKNINAYKIASYQTSYLTALELELDTPADLIQQVLEWETNVSKSLNSLAFHEFKNVADHSES